MNKTELVAQIAESTQITKTLAQAALDATLEAITAELAKGGDVVLVGFGTFTVKDRAARTGRNPATGEAIEIDGKKAPVFKAGANLKSAVN